MDAGRKVLAPQKADESKNLAKKRVDDMIKESAASNRRKL